ncbi:hypoxanthine/guanine phosphoribosyltransferase [Geoglobus acetivorans]|uniref:Hypoxanthine/guanine phosphoribosyltransferase n=1 Tax=Geoglobus acetivorans TaxID=565033 RepID=A0ABZ3H369_GEOAI|nr:purine phosphoribosyltransferase family protein [Geoglobus acetivorans]
MLSKLVKSLENAPVIMKGDYPYFIHPLTDGVPELDPDIVREAVSGIIRIADLDVDKIVTVEAMGIPVAMALSLAVSIPIVVVRKRAYNLPNEIVVDQETGYSKGKLYINGVDRGDRVILVDDVISTGGTALATLKALEKAGAVVKDFVAVVEKGDGANKLREAGYNVKSLVKIEVSSDGVRVIDHI